MEVKVTRDIFTDPEKWELSVIAPNAGDALDLIKLEILKNFAKRPELIHPFELTTWGVKGGKHHRFCSWEACVGGAMWETVGTRSTATQAELLPS